jgi:uncharacterized protein (DUF362 family)
MTDGRRVRVLRARGYDAEAIRRLLPDAVFSCVRPGDHVVLKPNWVMEGHKFRPDEWEQVITHPAVITAVLHEVIERLRGRGQVTIMDGPTTEASFRRLIARYPVDAWHAAAARAGIAFEVVDLRDWEWESRNDIIVRRHRLGGDPRGKTVVDVVGDASEFLGHRRSARGYHGADYDRNETNAAHDGHHNLYSVSRTALEADVFINLPKLKTHRKAGITCCLKNLVGINTYKNYLPHHNEGGPADGGDQYPHENVNARIEGPLLGFAKQHVLRNPRLASLLSPLNLLARRTFGDTREVVRSGNWHGNDTIWRMILDLNKVLLHAEPDGTLRSGQAPKRYIGVVDAIVAGEGHGPLAPDRVEMGYLVCGTNPVAIDAACAELMGFAHDRIPTIHRAFTARGYSLAEFGAHEIAVEVDGARHAVDALPRELVVSCEPQFGWKGHLERGKDERRAAG